MREIQVFINKKIFLDYFEGKRLITTNLDITPKVLFSNYDKSLSFAVYFLRNYKPKSGKGNPNLNSSEVDKLQLIGHQVITESNIKHEI